VIAGAPAFTPSTTIVITFTAGESTPLQIY
jgi:hypothetical protein